LFKKGVYGVKSSRSGSDYRHAQRAVSCTNSLFHRLCSYIAATGLRPGWAINYYQLLNPITKPIENLFGLNAPANRAAILIVNSCAILQNYSISAGLGQPKGRVRQVQKAIFQPIKLVQMGKNYATIKGQAKVLLHP
jgi:hypothetical protein